ncbi:MAG: DUF21 domain-containing protein [Alphaproteobacteria bacterium]|nr:DUF21 domain-containing protein [Alphaproteobacteria bacterium]
MDFVFSLSVVGILLVASAFFSMCETALTAASPARMVALEKDGDRKAARVNRILDIKDQMIGSILLGNNLVNISASAIATDTLVRMFGPTGVIYATIVMTAVIFIFAEVFPKTIALKFSDRLARYVALPIQMLITVLAPINYFVTRLINFFFSLFAGKNPFHDAEASLETLRGAIELHDSEEEEVQEQRAMLRSVLELADVVVEEVMIHRKNVEMVDINEPVEKTVQTVLNSSFTRFPIFRDNADNIIGVIHTKFLLRELLSIGNDTSKLDIGHIASDPWFVPETTTLYDQLQAFRERSEHFAIVVDEYGTYRGILTLEDILEEIVGNIDDEHDISVAGVRKLPNGGFMVQGNVTIRELNREFEWNLPDEDYNTVAGLVLFEAQSLPDVGQSFSFHGFRFDILKRQRNQITLVRMTPVPEKLAA